MYKKQKAQYAYAAIERFNQELRRIQGKTSPTQFAAIGQAFSQQILQMLLQLGLPSDTIVEFNPQWKG